MTLVAAHSDIASNRIARGWTYYERIVRRLILAALTVLVILHAGELHRRVRFWLTGAVRVDGLLFYLNADDAFLTECVLEHGTWEPEETRLMCQRLRLGDTVVDVGANIGWYTLFASRQVGDTGLVIAFEPDPTTFAILQRNVEANGVRNVRLEQKAVSNKHGSVTLFCHESNKGMHSLLRSDAAEDHFEVEAVSLDEYLRDDLCSPRVDLVKIDVEGAEGWVLEGMHDTLVGNPHMSMLLEFAPTRLVDAGYDPQALLTQLAYKGFGVYDIDGPYGLARTTTVNDLFRRMNRQRLIFTNLLLCGRPTAADFP